jgi:glycosyltransferase involved in cell wall biosynthesis
VNSEVFVSCLVYIDASTLSASGDILNRASSELSGSFTSFEIVAVVDTDYATSTGELGRLEPETRDRLVIVDLAYHHGIEQAMMAAAQVAVGDFIIEVDAPTRIFPFSLLAELVAHAQGEAVDVIGGVPQAGLRRSSRSFYRLIRLLRISHRPLTTETVRVVSRRALNRALADRRKLRYRKLLYLTTGFEYRQLVLPDLPAPPRTSTWRRMALAVDLLAGGSKVGSASAAALSIIFLVVSLGIGAYALVIKIIGLPILPGWTTIMAFLSIGFAGIFAVLSIIARMISIALAELFTNAPFAVREVFRAQGS